MADFATWVVACEPALDWESGTFLHAYERNQGEANQVSLDASPIGALIQEIARSEREWIGTPTALWQKLTEMADQKAQKQAGWPQNGKAVSGQLKRIAPNLRAQGVMVNRLRKAKERQIQIFLRDAQTASFASQRHQTEGENDTDDASDALLR
jgi:hypothetical protein